jgi:hypothetical protein
MVRRGLFALHGLASRINILNPKLSIFFLAFLPQFVAVDETQPLGRMLELSGVFMAMTFAVFAVYGLFAAAVRDRVITRPKVMTWLGGVCRRFRRARRAAGAGGEVATARRRHCEQSEAIHQPQRKRGLLCRCRSLAQTIRVVAGNDGGGQPCCQK